jgi:hypothetical protein
VVKIEKIPNVDDFLEYLFKLALIFLALRSLLSQSGLYNPALLAIASTSAAFQKDAEYVAGYFAIYLLFIYISLQISSEFILLFIYFTNIFVNTCVMTMYVKRKYAFVED